MEIKGRNALQHPGPIKFREESKRRRRPIRHFRGTQAEAVPHRQAQALQKRNAEVAEALSGRDGWITVVVEFEILPRKPFVQLKPTYSPSYDCHLFWLEYVVDSPTGDSDGRPKCLPTSPPD